MQPIISIVIPCYNYGNYLNETFGSLIRQSLQLWECILVDNDSTDNTRLVCENICKADSRFRYFKIANDGPAKARNFGIERSNGRYIQFLDADDLLQSEKLKFHTDVLDNNPEVDLVYGRARFFTDGNPNTLFYSLNGGMEEWIPNYSGEGKYLIRRLILGNIMPVCSPVFRKSIFGKNGLMDEQLKGYEDWDLFLRLAIANFRFQFLEAENTFPLIRSHEKSLSKTPGHMDLFLITVLEKNIFHRGLSIVNRIFILFRYLQQRSHLISRKIRGVNAMIIHSNHVKRNTLMLLQFLLFVYFPIYILIEAMKLALRIFGIKI